MARRGNRRKRGDARLRLVHADEVEQRVELASEMRPLMHEIRSRMRDADPISLLSFISSVIAATDGRHGFDDSSSVALDDLVDSFIDVDIAETTAALHVLAALAPTQAMQARAASTLNRRRQPMPRWLDELSATTVTAAGRVGFQDEPGQNLLIEYRWPDGQVASYVIFDEGLGRGVKDAFPAPDKLDDIAERMRESAPFAARLTYEPLDLATARATIEQGLVTGANRPVDDENDTWPSGRPLVEWLLSLMPAGGTPHPSITSFAALDDRRLNDLGLDDLFAGADNADLDAAVDDFAASAEASAIRFDLSDVHDHAAIETIVDYASMLGVRDPFSWDEEGVYELLESYLPSLVLPDPTTARRLQPVLEAFLTFSSRQIGQSKKERAGVLRAARQAMPDYLEIALSPQAQTLRQALIDYDELTEGLASFDVNIIGEGVSIAGLSPDALEALQALEALEAEVALGVSGPAGAPSGLEELVLQHLLEQLITPLGSIEAVEALDDTPLPDESLHLTEVPEDVRPAVESVSRLVDGFADEFFGVEFRTAARRFLARAAAGDPSIFRRKGRDDTAAAAVAWAVARGNQLVSAPGAQMTVQELAEHFGTKGSPSTRARPFIGAVDTASYSAVAGPTLGSPDLLTSSMRAGLIELRERVASGRLVPRGWPTG